MKVGDFEANRKKVKMHGKCWFISVKYVTKLETSYVFNTLH